MTLPRRIAIGLWIILPVLIALGLARLHFDAEVLDLLPSNNRAVQGLKLYQQRFSNARELIITVEDADAEQTESAARAIAIQLRKQTNLVTGVVWQPPWLENPGQTAELIGYLWLNQPPSVFDELTKRLSPTNLPTLLADARDQLAGSMSPNDIARLSYDPLRLTDLPEAAAGAAPSFTGGQNLFSSQDGKFRILFVEASTPLATYKECFAWLQSIQANVAIARAENHLAPDLKVDYTGRPAFVSEIARGMERDVTISVGGTSLIIAILFYLAHRRVKPMLWLLTLLALILAGTLALGGLIYGNINVVSMGFAAILLGLAVDYAVVHYQEAMAHPNLTVPEIRSAIAPSIFWAATTTISAFLVLNFGGLPGLGQLGTLVGVGVALSAFVMIFAYLPPLFPERRKARPPGAAASDKEMRAALHPTAPKHRKLIFAGTAAMILFSLGVLSFDVPKMDPTAYALRPRNSKSYAALDRISQALGQKQEPLWLLISGANEREVERKLDAAKPLLDEAVTNQVLTGFTLASAIWPRTDFQATNRVTAQALVAERDSIHSAVLTNGFTEAALGLANGILNTWERAGQENGVFWPTNELDRWILNKLVARTSTNFYAVGFLYPSTNSETGVIALKQKLEMTPNVWLSGWQLIGRAVLDSVMSNLWKLVLPMVGLVMLSLWLAFRRPLEILLSLGVLALSALCLLAIMHLLGWSWNLLNLMGIPLILGTGVDYSIFMQLALRRYHGDLGVAHRAVGRALLLCGGTATAGFGALTFSSNAGMSSLGQVCAIGIAGNMLISVFLLPTWWSTLTNKKIRTVP